MFWNVFDGRFDDLLALCQDFLGAQTMSGRIRG